MTMTNAEELEFDELSPRRLGRGRRIGVIVLGAILIAAACIIISLAFVQGSWWYNYAGGQTLDHESRARIEAIRDDVDASDRAPRAVMWLNAALDPNADLTAVEAYLLSAQEVLEAADDPQLAEAAEDSRAIIETIQSPTARPPDFKATVTPYPVPTLEWPW